MSEENDLWWHPTHEVLQGARKWAVTRSDCLTYMKRLPDASIDLVFGSPPYEDRRRYAELDFKLKGQAWVDWMVELIREMVRVSKGLVAMVIGHGVTRKYRWSATPALLPVIDAAALSAKTDGVVLVVAAGRTDTESAKRAIQRLQFATTSNILGVVMISQQPLADARRQAAVSMRQLREGRLVTGVSPLHQLFQLQGVVLRRGAARRRGGHVASSRFGRT